MIEERLLDIVQPDVMWVGGLTELMKIAAHAAACRQIFVRADALAGARVDQHDIKRLELMANARELGFHLRRAEPQARIDLVLEWHGGRKSCALELIE